VLKIKLIRTQSRSKMSASK